MLVCSLIGCYRAAAGSQQGDQGKKCEQLFHNACFRVNVNATKRVFRIKNEPEYKRNDCAKIGFSTYKNIRNASTCCCPMDYEKK
jgi:hypothetical protein